jgi:hypothetical protein
MNAVKMALLFAWLPWVALFATPGNGQVGVEKPSTARGDGVDFQVSLGREKIAPFEAVRMKIRVVNRGSLPLRLRNDPFFTDIRQVAAGGEPIRIRSDHGRRPDRDDLRHYAMQRASLVLAPGKEVSVSIPIAVGEATAGQSRVEPPPPPLVIARQIGPLDFRMEYQATAENEAPITAAASLVVVEPDEEGAKFVAQCRTDPRLGSAILDRVAPQSHEVYSRLVALLESPESVYSDYVRVALARMALGYDGTARTLLADEPMLEAAAHEFLRWLPPDPVAAEKFCRQHVYHPFRTEEEVTSAIREVLASNSKDDETRIRAARRLAALRFAGDDDLKSATKWLKEVRSENFPFRPDVLIMLKHLYEKRNAPEEAAKVVEELEAEYYDSVEWLYFRALKVEPPGRVPQVKTFNYSGAKPSEPPKLMTFDEWAKYRIR